MSGLVSIVIPILLKDAIAREYLSCHSLNKQRVIPHQNKKIKYSLSTSTYLSQEGS
jgi:hypothetical protein